MITPLLSALALLCTQAPDADPASLRALVISGANNHDFRWTTPSLERILEETGRFEVDTTFAPAKALGSAAEVEPYDVFVLDYNGKAWGEPAQTVFLDAVRGGTGVVVIHAADNNGNGWVEYERLVGDLWREGTGHGRFHSFDVEMVDRDHPITRTLPTILLHPDELYHDLVNVHGVERRVLATAFSDRSTGGTGEAEPMVLVRSYGEGRVFHTPLGHVWKGNVPSQASHRDPQFRGLVVRGAEWAATGAVSDERSGLEPITDEDKAAGWISLADPARWSASPGETRPWIFDSDVMRCDPGSGELSTAAEYWNFELTFEWKTTIAGTPRVAYRVPTYPALITASSPGLEGGPSLNELWCSLADPWADTKDPDGRAGALSGKIAATAQAPGTWGDFRAARIVVRDQRIQHWIDGELVMEAVLQDLSNERGGRQIQLDPNGNELFIRGIRVRALDDKALVDPDLARLFTEDDLSKEWFNVGDATYALERGVLVGRAGPKRKQSFLVSREVLHDFELNVDVRIVTTGNSGIQLRSHVRGGRMRGYQAEVDPSDRSWSGGIYGEGGRNWLFDLKDNQDAREAFDVKGWNNYRIRCEGPRIRTWVNGVPAADLLDADELSGHLGFQIHGGDDDIEIRWRDARLRRLGAHGWTSEFPPSSELKFEESDAIRAWVKGDAAICAVVFDDGSTQDLSLAESKFWHDGGRNQVTVIRSGTRFVLMLDDDHIQRLDQDKRPVTVRFKAAEKIDSWSRCLKQ